MSKLTFSARIPQAYTPASIAPLFRELQDAVNGLAEGNVTATYNASTAAPTTGSHTQGDFIRNKQPSEAGGAGSKYVVLGWVCTVSGTPGTWVACRCLTGN